MKPYSPSLTWDLLSTLNFPGSIFVSACPYPPTRTHSTQVPQEN